MSILSKYCSDCGGLFIGGACSDCGNVAGEWDEMAESQDMDNLFAPHNRERLLRINAQMKREEEARQAAEHDTIHDEEGGQNERGN